MANFLVADIPTTLLLVVHLLSSKVHTILVHNVSVIRVRNTSPETIIFKSSYISSFTLLHLELSLKHQKNYDCFQSWKVASFPILYQIIEKKLTIMAAMTLTVA